MINTHMDVIARQLEEAGRKSKSDIIKRILEDDRNSKAKKRMLEGERYYDGEHDILKHDFRQSIVYEDTDAVASYSAATKPIVNENNSNHHNVHNFHQQHVDQKVSYILGRAPSVTVEGASKSKELKAFEDAITAITSDEAFADTLGRYVIGASNNGVEWLHPYYDKAGNLQYRVIPAKEFLPIYDTEYEEELREGIRYYPITVIEDGREKTRHKVEWWTAQDVTYWEENDRGEYVLDAGRTPNPHAHWYDVETVDGVPVASTARSWERVPFIPLYNNSLKFGDLTRIKGLQDAYNMISSAVTNNQIDLVELYWMISGYGGETAKAIQRKLQINKAVSISDPSGKIQAEQVNLSVTDRIAWLKLLRNDMYHIGMAVDMNDDTLGNTPSGVALAFKYTPLDMKADMLIAKLRRSMKELFWYLTQDINMKNSTSYDSALIRFDINKSRISNDAETVELIMNSQGLVPDTILLAKHPLVDDVNQALEDLATQKKERASGFLNSDIPPDNNGSGE